MTQVLKNTVVSLQASCRGMDIPLVFKKLVSLFPDAVTFSTSFGYEDQVITDLIYKSGQPVSFLRWIPAGYSMKPIVHGAVRLNNTK